jgi:hypothetical protein
MRELDQKYWDAMIIRSWNKFETCNQLSNACFFEFGDYPNKLKLKRNTQMFGGVRAWVACYMPELSEKLWNVPKEKQIELLNWLQTTKIDVQKMSKKANNYGTEASRLTYKNKKLLQQKTLSRDLEKTLNRNNMWQVVK